MNENAYKILTHPGVHNDRVGRLVNSIFRYRLGRQGVGGDFCANALPFLALPFFNLGGVVAFCVDALNVERIGFAYFR